ncbi:hypothetical protein BG006_002418 [Podila minutissima]|uniref:DUF4442 domain-containing protein n=1 Tax=Podila minutissima TaxID=64525 RepID=A0A9P5VGS7_9FUNG|nr:hypothetical protein BG006_002418 [Podila minutissima]
MPSWSWNTVLGLVVLYTALHILWRYIRRRISQNRDPILVWQFLNSALDFLPIRLRAWLFSLAVGFANPYSRSIHYRITEVEKGKVCGVMKETPETSNTLKCVHAAALITFGETVGTLTVLTWLGEKDRVILTNINCEYIKVARGYLTATSLVPDFKETHATDLTTEVVIKNQAFDTVSKLILTWKVDLKDE